MALFDLLINLRADTAQLVSGMDQAQKKIDSFVSSVEKTVSGIAAFGALGISVESIAHSIEKAVESGAQLERMATRVGVSGQAFSELAYAAKQTGLGTDQLAVALTKMDQAMSKAATGDKAVTQTLEALGLSFRNLQRLTPDQQLEVLADRISRLPTPADKARAEIALFGRAGAELAPFLEQGAAGIEKLRTEAVELGASFSDDLLKKLEQSEQSIKRMDSAFSALWTTIAAKISPSLTQMGDALTATITDDKVLALQAQIERLREITSGAGAVAEGPGFVATREQNRRTLEMLEAQLQMLQQANSLAKQFEAPDMTKLLGGSSPGYASTVDPLSEIRISAQKVSQDKMTSLLEGYGKDTQTELERIANDYYKFEAELDELYKGGLISAAEYATRYQAELDKILPGVQVTDKIKLLPKSAEQSFDELQKIGEKTGEALEKDFAQLLFEPFHGGLKRMEIDFLETLRRMTADAAAAKIFEALFGKKTSDEKGLFGSGGLGGVLGSALGNLWGSSSSDQTPAEKRDSGGSASGGLSKVLGSWISNLFGGGSGAGSGLAAFASGEADSAIAAGNAGLSSGLSSWIDAMAVPGLADGGPVSAGSTYLVGEQGPELFTAASHGMITSNADLGGDTHFHMGDVNIDARGADAGVDARLRAMLPGILAAHQADTAAKIFQANRRRGIPSPARL